MKLDARGLGVLSHGTGMFLLLGSLMLIASGTNLAACVFSPGTCFGCSENSSSGPGGGNAPGAGGQGGAGGSPGVGGGGGAGGGMACPPEALTGQDSELVARYFIDEDDGDASTVPSTLKDSSSVGNPVNLDVLSKTLSGDVDPQMAQEPAHWGLQWTQATSTDASARGQIENTKFIDMLDGTQTLTIELVARVQAASSGQEPSRFLSIGSTALTASQLDHLNLSIGGELGEGIVGAYWQGSVAEPETLAGVWQVDMAERRVMHLVLDTTSEDRLLLYVDGVLMPALSPIPMLLEVVPPEENETLRLQDDANEVVTLGNSAGDGASFQGVLHYAAIYKAALTPDQVEAHRCALVVSDDAPSP